MDESKTPESININNLTKQNPKPSRQHNTKFNKTFITGALLLLSIIIIAVLVAKEYLRGLKFTGGVKKVISSEYYKDYLKNTHTYLESGNGEYVNYRTCNVTNTDALWNFKQPEDSRYYYPSFSMVYNSLEGQLRGEHSEVKENLPTEYKSNVFSRVVPSLDSSIQKRQEILNLSGSMEVLFNGNEYINFCQSVYSDAVDRLSRIQVNADGTNTVVSGTDTDFSKKQAEDIVSTLEREKVPAGFEQVNKEFITTIKAIVATYSEVSKGINTSDSVRRYRESFQAHKTNLDKNLRDLSGVAKQKITIQPDTIGLQLKNLED